MSDAHQAALKDCLAEFVDIDDDTRSQLLGAITVQVLDLPGCIGTGHVWRITDQRPDESIDEYVQAHREGGSVWSGANPADVASGIAWLLSFSGEAYIYGRDGKEVGIATALGHYSPTPEYPDVSPCEHWHWVEKEAPDDDTVEH